jgi:hypothetical protein
VEPARRRRAGELADGVDDPAPHGGAVVILFGEKLIGARGAFLDERFLPVALEHQAGCAPDVDLRYHGKSKLTACRRVIQTKERLKPTVSAPCVRFVPTEQIKINF